MASLSWLSVAGGRAPGLGCELRGSVAVPPGVIFDESAKGLVVAVFSVGESFFPNDSWCNMVKGDFVVAIFSK